MTRLSHRLMAEGLGTMLLLSIVIGSGVMAERLAGGNLAIALLANTLATVWGLYVLIHTLGPTSGAHFNPAVSHGPHALLARPESLWRRRVARWGVPAA